MPIAEEHYCPTNSGQQEIPLPRIHLYDLSEGHGRSGFLKALYGYPSQERTFPWSSYEPGDILQEALQRDVLVDRYDLYLEDIAKLKGLQGQVAGRQALIDQYDTWEDTVIAEYPWEQKGRFVRIPREKVFYEVAYSRNNFIISQEVQQHLRETRFAIDGMGVGTAIAYGLVLSGAQHFLVVDGGLVTLHDHNRLLGADVRQDGLNHAIHWARLALKSNPYLKIDCAPQNLAGDGKPNTFPIRAFVDGAGVILEEADDLNIKREVRDAAKAKGKPVFMGTDLGTEGLVQFETPHPHDLIFGGRLSQEVNQILQDQQLDQDTKTAIAVGVIVGMHNIPAEYKQALDEAKAAHVPYWPQSWFGAFASARGVGLAIMDYLQGKAIPLEKPIR